MWFIGVEVEQETSAPPPKKKSWIRPCLVTTCFRFSDSRAFQYTAWHQMFLVWSYRCLHRLPKSASHPMKQQDHFEDGQVSVTCRRYAFDFQPDIKNCQTEFCCSCFGRERLNPPVFQFRILTPLTVSKPGLPLRGRRARPRRNGNGVNPFPWKFTYRKSLSRNIFHAFFNSDIQSEQSRVPGSGQPVFK